ncbi:MAG: hypothetical protein DMG15_00940 [Acidobacteria bacterium]|nr:MAG: hypothetical protein DMG15_00940 [Acidobacteriota bacterium]
MVRRIGALLGFANTRDSELLVFGQNVLERLFENPAYPKPPLKKETFKTLLDSYGAAITAALDGSKQAIAERNGLRAEVIAALRQLGHYAQYTCNDDMPTFISADFSPPSWLVLHRSHWPSLSSRTSTTAKAANCSSK